MRARPAQAKFTQINEFLKLLSHSGALEQLAAARGDPGAISAGARQQPVRVLDAGCGSSHLTLGVYHWMAAVLGLAVRLDGVDTNAALMARSNAAAAELGIADAAAFHVAPIRGALPLLPAPPHLVLALHACDTATDDALAVGVAARAALIAAAPCCHKDLHRQLQRRGAPAAAQDGVVDALSPLLAHGILRQRQLDLLTDGLRAALLRLAGYRTDVVEFVSAEHTARNLLIRAARAARPAPASEVARLAREYVRLRDAWGVSPRLEALLREDGSLPPHVVAALDEAAARSAL